MKRTTLSAHELTGGFSVPANALAGREGTLADGSRNQIRTFDGFVPWKGMTALGAGSRKMVQLGGTWGGIKDIGTLEGRGSLFEDIGRSVWGIGSGQPHRETADLPFTLSTTLKVSLAVNGNYSAGTTYTAGLPQPSAPDVGIPTAIGLGFVGNINGPVSVKLARLRLSTGARSVASPTSVVVEPSNQTIRVTFPLAATGQDYWAVFFTQSGFGGVGLHYRGPYNGTMLDIPESLVAASTIDGIGRSLEFDFKDGDLVPEVAYIDDYVPPAGTHAVRLENVMIVLGAYGDSTAPVSSTNPGTVGAVSLPNFYESYKPRHLVYFPEQIVDVMARPTDQYAYVGHRDCITALQYVGVRDGPAVAVTMVSPDIGIAKPHNWCQVHGLLYVFAAKGGAVRMRADSSWDYEFARDVRHVMKDWRVEDTIVSPHPDTLSVVYANGNTALSYSLQTGEWSAICYLKDGNCSGSVLACVSTVGRLIISVIDPNGSHIAYAWHEGATRMPISSFTQWQRSLRPSTVMELNAGFDTDVVRPVLYSVHRNQRRKYVTDARVTTGNASVESAQAQFNLSHIGSYVIVFGDGVGAGVDYLVAQITSISGNIATLSAAANATREDCYMVLAAYVGTYTVSVPGQQHTPPLLDVFVDECLSHCVGLHTIVGSSGNFSFAEALGTTHLSPAALTA